MPEAKNVIISWNIEVWGVLSVSYEYEGTNPEGATEFQRYRNWELISWETANTYTILITDQSATIICAVAPFDDQGNQWEIAYSNEIEIDFYPVEQPIEKEYIVKVYDKNMNFMKIIPTSIIINDISITETINAGQWQLTLNLNLPLETNYFDGVRYCKIFESDNKGNNNLLIYSWYISQIQRLFSNQSENIKVIFLWLSSLLSNVVYRNWNGDIKFSITDDPSNIIKWIIDYFDTKYTWILSYTNDSIQTYWETITIEFKGVSCLDAIEQVLKWLNYYLFIGADWVVNYKQKPETSVHDFTYWKDVETLTIPENFENIINVVQVEYEKNQNTEYTPINQDWMSVAKYWYKEEIIRYSKEVDDDTALLYRDNFILQNKDLKNDITITINTIYNIETIHPWDTIKIRNLWIKIENLQIKNIKYQYEKVVLILEYYTTIADQIFNSLN